MQPNDTLSCSAAATAAADGLEQHVHIAARVDLGHVLELLRLEQHRDLVIEGFKKA